MLVEHEKNSYSVDPQVFANIFTLRTCIFGAFNGTISNNDVLSAMVQFDPCRLLLDADNWSGFLVKVFKGVQ